ncbi:amidohydrolase family protein [Haloechinothrix salitolerans]|uniref:Amidohydrolase family protein n=1 Tax=Haloechinothrix salitolerans TaxID=926830 RepID=A0ABW2C3E1_9PSEU
MAPLHLHGVVLPDGEERDLWLVDGRITHEPVAGAETVVRSGYLLPGLVDAHCHIGIGPTGGVDIDTAERQALTERDAGVLLVRDCGVPIDTRPLQGRSDLPRIVRAGRHLARPKRYMRGFGVDIENPDALPEFVAEQVAYGDGWVKLVGDWIDREVGDLAPLWPDDVLDQAIKVAHEGGARVTAHVFGEAALPGLLAAGIDCIEHGTGLTEETIAEMVRRDVPLVPTLINIANFPDIAAQAAKYPDYAAHMLDLHARCDDTIRAAHDAGVRLYTGTDAGSVVQHGRIVDEIEALHRVGLTPEQAIGAASWHAREWLGYSGLVDGAEADVLAFDSDPRDNLAVLRDPSAIVLRGVVVR